MTGSEFLPTTPATKVELYRTFIRFTEIDGTIHNEPYPRNDTDMSVTVVTWHRTCESCPTQYNLYLDDGRYLYFRYRSGVWRLIGLPDPSVKEWTQEIWNSAPMVGGVIGSQYDGYLSHDEVVSLVSSHLPTLLAKM